jgi:hypothetical protein
MSTEKQRIKESMARLEAYAESRGFRVGVSGSDVALVQGEMFEAELIGRRSEVGPAMAAFYLVNTLERLGVEVPSVPDGSA